MKNLEKMENWKKYWGWDRIGQEKKMNHGECSWNSKNKDNQNNKYFIKCWSWLFNNVFCKSFIYVNHTESLINKFKFKFKRIISVIGISQSFSISGQKSQEFFIKTSCIPFGLRKLNNYGIIYELLAF